MSGGGNWVPIVTSSTVFHSLIELRPFMKSINVNVVVIKKGKTCSLTITPSFPTSRRKVHQGWTRVRSFLVADPVRLHPFNFWDEIGASVLDGDILQILGALSHCIKDSLDLDAGSVK